MVVLVKWVCHIYFSSNTFIFESIGARVLLFLAFLMAFGSVIGGAWVFFGYYIPYKKDTLYPGVAVFVQNLLIFIRFVGDIPFIFYCISFFLLFQYIDSEIWP